MNYERMGLQLFDGLMEIEKRPSKRPGLPALLVINMWRGRYNTAVWDTL